MQYSLRHSGSLALIQNLPFGLKGSTADYWADKLFPNILEMSGADMLVYGMGEQPLREVVRLLQKGVPFSSITTIKQTAVLLDADAKVPKNSNWEDVEIVSHETCLKDKKKFASNFKTIEQESNKLAANEIKYSDPFLMLAGA